MKKPKTPRQKIILENDKLFSAIIRARDKACQMTGRKENLQVCHYWTRENLRVRWDLDNAVLLNAGRHKFFAHKYPDKFKEWFIKRIGQRKFDALELKARFVAPIKMEFLLFSHWELKKKVKGLGNDH